MESQIDKIKEEFVKEFGYIDEDSNWWLSKIEEVRNEAISQHNELLIKKIEEELLKDLEHDYNGFCKKNGEQFKECARCYIERKLQIINPNKK